MYDPPAFVWALTISTVSLTLGALTGFQLIHVTPSAAPIGQLPLALIITADVPLMIALHIASLRALARAPRPAPSAAGPPTSGCRAERCGAGPAVPRPVRMLTASEHCGLPAGRPGTLPRNAVTDLPRLSERMETADTRFITGPGPGARPPSPQHRLQWGSMTLHSSG